MGRELAAEEEFGDVCLGLDQNHLARFGAS
jgi:hypothetical protein